LSLIEICGDPYFGIWPNNQRMLLYKNTYFACV